MANKIVTLEVEGTNRGRPKKRWHEHDQADMRNLSIDKVLTADRAAWRAARCGNMTRMHPTPVTGKRRRAWDTDKMDSIAGLSQHSTEGSNTSPAQLMQGRNIHDFVSPPSGYRVNSKWSHFLCQREIFMLKNNEIFSKQSDNRLTRRSPNQL